MPTKTTTTKMNHHRNNDARFSPSIFNSFLSSNHSSSLPQTTQPSRFHPLKSQPTDSLLLPFQTTTTTTPFHNPSSLKRPQTILNVVVPTSKIARKRRTRLSDKTRCLQKLIPFERQMDTATLYDHTFKYVKFLEAQIALLQSMRSLQITTTLTASPTTHRRLRHPNNIDNLLYGCVAELQRLNRQQLLQVLMNSQVAQTVLYMNGWCVYSAEQLEAFFNDPEKQGAVVEQILI